MKHRFLAEDNKGSFSYGTLLLGLLVLLPGPLLYYAFLHTGHLAGSGFRKLSLLEFVGTLVVTLLFPRLRHYLYAFALFALPRAFSLVLGAESHNLLYPLFYGLAVSVWLRGLVHSVRGSVPHRDGRHDDIAVVQWIVLLFVLVQILRAFLAWYDPGGWNGGYFQDREVAPGVSAHYATYLALLVGLNLLGPLQFFLVDRMITRTPGEEISHRLLVGFAAGGVLSLMAALLQSRGVLFAGSALSLEAGRYPGLFTDSGASSLLFPSLFLLLYLFARDHLRLNSEKNKRILHLILMAGIGPLFLYVAAHQGRTFYLTAPAVLLFVVHEWYVTASARGAKFVRKRYLAAIVVALIAASIPLSLLMLQTETGHRLMGTVPETLNLLFHEGFYRAYEHLDSPRYLQFRAGMRVIADHPWIGNGLNSFMVATAPLRLENPMLFPDSPPLLFMGVLSDAGWIGLLLFLGISLYIVRRIFLLRGERQPLSRRMAVLPLLLIPGFFVGYHFVFAEFFPFLALPLLLLAPKTETATDPDHPAS